MRESSKAALCGIIAALAVVIMLITYLSPLLVYTAPPFAGILLIVILSEVGYSRAIGTYAAISIMSVFIIADKESAVFFALFFGYYPILRSFLVSKINNRVVLYIIKFITYNLAIFVSVLLCMFVFNIDYSEFGEGGKLMSVAFVVLMNVVFIIYDFLLTKVIILYNLRIQKKLRKLFRR